MKEIIINHFFDYEFVYIFLFCSIIFLLIPIFIKSKIIRRISILLFSIFFVLFGFEFGLSFFVEKVIINDKSFFIRYKKDIDACSYKDNFVYEINILNNDTGCKEALYNQSDLKKYKNYTTIYNAKYNLYNNDFRYTKGNENSIDTYIFLGCSVVFGVGISDDETLPYCFSKLFDFDKNVINCGVRATSMNTVLNILNNNLFYPLVKKSKIKRFFLDFIGKEHIMRLFRIEGNCSDIYIFKNNKLYISTTINKIKYMFIRSYIFRKVFVPIIDKCFQKYYENYMIQSLIEMNKIIEEKYKSKLTIIIWPLSTKFSFISKTFITRLKETNLDLIFLPEYFGSQEKGYAIKKDGHPTAKANKEIAEILYNHINGNDSFNKE